MIKLSEPKKGWINIEIENDIYFASYLTDIPIDLIDSCFVMLKKGLPFILEIDSEDRGIFTIINSNLQQNLIVSNGKKIKEYKYIEPLDLASYICDYLIKNKEKLYNWFYFEDNKEEIQKYKNQLNQGLIKLEEIIELEKNNLYLSELE